MAKIHLSLFIFLFFGCISEIKLDEKKSSNGKKTIEKKFVKIAAFNTKTFGTKKSSDPDILKKLIQVLFYMFFLE